MSNSKFSYGNHKSEKNNKDLMLLLKAAKQDQLGATNDRTAEESHLRYPTEAHALVQSTIQKGTTMEDKLSIRTTLLKTTEATIVSMSEKDGMELADLIQGARDMLSFTATAQNTWDISKFVEWKYQVELTILDGMNKVFRSSHDDKFLKLIYGAQVLNNGVVKNKNINVRGLQICHELMLSSPYVEPADLDGSIKKLIEEKRPDLIKATEDVNYPCDDMYNDGYVVTPEDIRDYVKPGYIMKAEAELDDFQAKLKKMLQGMYLVNSHTFHVLMWDLFDGARQDKSVEFTQLKEKRRQHQQRFINGEPGYEKQYTAEDTLMYLARTYVKDSDENLHISWTAILLNTRNDGVSLYDWCRTFSLLRETWLRLANAKPTKKKKKVTFGKKMIRAVNKLIMGQTTDFEQQAITSIIPENSTEVLTEGE